MPNPKLSAEEVQILRREFPITGLTMGQWGRRLGVTRECVWRALHRRSWKTLKETSDRDLINSALQRWNHALRA